MIQRQDLVLLGRFALTTFMEEVTLGVTVRVSWDEVAYQFLARRLGKEIPLCTTV